MPTKKSYIIFQGLVQGVFFRKHVKKVADHLGLKGQVENLKNGEVKVIVEADGTKVEKFIEEIYKTQKFSKIENHILEEVFNNDVYSDFSILKEDKYLKDKYRAFLNLLDFFGKYKIKKEELHTKNTFENLPKHLVIIPDGNRRWAKARGLSSIVGHKKGLDRFNEIADLCYFLDDIKVLTFWCFSTENWGREKEEINYLMSLFLEALDKFEQKFLEKKICFVHLGRKDRLPREVVEKIKNLEQKTKDFQGKTICLAMDYGGRDEILRTVQKITQSGEEINEKNFNNLLDTKGLPDVDYIIRTSGEKRLSGILPWQSTYAELYFTDKHFPDFTKKELEKALQEYSLRKRRFGR